MAILNFCVKRKNEFISKTERDRTISMKFLNRRVYAEYSGNFPQKLFFCHFWRPSRISALNAKTRLSRKRSDKIFDPQGICTVYCRLFSKIIFPPLLAAILNFCVKCKNVFISEMQRDRAISTKFLTHGICRVYWHYFAKNTFSRHFWRPS